MPRTLPNRPVRSWRSVVLSAGFAFFLVVFVGMIVLFILGDAFYVDRSAVKTVLTAPFIRRALWLSVWTSLTTVTISLIFAVPIGYALSRFRFPGRAVADALVDLPIVFPPLVAGMTLLVFFYQTALGKAIQEHVLEFAFQPAGIVLCQFFVSASYAIRSAKSAFDDIDRRVENVALTLGCTEWGSFLHVSLPLARSGIVAGGILTWARAFGIFGPLMIFVGATRSEYGRTGTEVLPSTIYLEQSIGHLKVALAAALLLIGFALLALVGIRAVGGRASPKL